MPQNKPQSEHAVLSTLSEHSPAFDSLIAKLVQVSSLGICAQQQQLLYHS